MTVKINQLELENVKRIKAVKVEPTQNGLTIIGGRNGQGKTSVLDAIAWALGGDTFKPSRPQNDKSVIPPHLKVKLSNGIVVERKGKNSALKVTDTTGKKAGQALLDSFIEKLALNVPKFMASSDKEKANILLQIIGVGPQLMELERQEKEAYQDRLMAGRIADQKKKFAKEQIHYDGVPDQLVSPQELINQQQAILAQNGENARKRENVSNFEYLVKVLTDEVASLQKRLNDKQKELEKATNDLAIAKTNAMDLVDQSTEELENNLREIEEVNRKVRANLDKQKAEEDAHQAELEWENKDSVLKKVRQDKMDLLKGANLPLEGLSIEDSALVYKGQKWDNMSSAEQLIVATSIVRKLNPQCGMVLVDKLEQMDTETLKEFGQWAEKEGLQIIGTRVSTGSECSIIIEDGYVKDAGVKPASFDAATDASEPLLQSATQTWKAGSF